MVSSPNHLHFVPPTTAAIDHNHIWQGPLEALIFDEANIQQQLSRISQPSYLVHYDGQIALATEGRILSVPNNQDNSTQAALLAVVPVCPIEFLGDANFCATYGVDYAYASGAMANGIASEDLVIAMGQAKLLSSFGAAGLPRERLEAAIQRIQTTLPEGPYAFNLIHSPNEDALERQAVELYLQYGVSTVEASAFITLTPHVVRYRVAGLALNAQNEIEIKNKIIAKLSRREVATQFMEPAPAKILRNLLEQGLITEQQAALAAQVPMADDVTVEADSGGHTDNQPLVSLLPDILALRDEIQAKYRYPTPIRIGAAGGISTPAAALAAFMMGAAYVVSGSVNQACLEAASSSHTKKLLAEADMADVTMAPAADMFEMGVKVQVLKKGTLFPMRAQKLYDLYQDYDSIDAIPSVDREKIEKQIFKRSLDAVWDDTVAFFNERDPDQITRAANNPKRKMALIFRWYLGLSSRWSNVGEVDRQIDFQIWCGPSMGAFNSWVNDSYLADPANRRVAEVGYHIMTGAAYLYRLQYLKVQGVQLPTYYSYYKPIPIPPTISPDNREREKPITTKPSVKTQTLGTHPNANNGPITQDQPNGIHQPANPLADAKPDAETIQTWLVNQLAARLGTTPDEIDIREPFDNYNLDSAQVLVLAAELETWLDYELSPTLLWNYPTIEALAERLATQAI